MRTKEKRQTREAFAVVVDGETEKWYLQMLVKNETNISSNIKPHIPKNKDIDEQYKLVRDLSKKEEEYDKVFWIVDLDVLLKEEREKKSNPSSLQKFLSYWQQLSKQNKVVVIVNNPCLEYWFLLHYKKTNKVFTACTDAEKQVSQKLKGYEKTEKFFKKDNDIYKQLKPYLQTAKENATALGSFDTYNHSKAMCEMPLLFQELKLEEH